MVFVDLQVAPGEQPKVLAPQAPAAQIPASSAKLLPEALPEEGLVLVDTLDTCKEFCKLWQQKSSWAFALDYTAADTRASKQLEMPRVGPAAATGQWLSFWALTCCKVRHDL